MIDELYARLLGPVLFGLPPELAHKLSILGLKSGILPGVQNNTDDRLAVRVAGLDFPNPIGIAAGYDKNAEVPNALLQLGFGYAEIGTITPRPQQGNPPPRLFRLVSDAALINRLGFNNQGYAAAMKRLLKRSSNGIIGVNIGANKDTADFIADYVRGIEVFAHFANYFTVNISSPNTPGLRNLQTGMALKELLDRVLDARQNAVVEGHPNVPVFLKIAPDLVDKELDEIADVVGASALDGMIISNTTLARPFLCDNQKAGEQGGLSGKPLFIKSTIMLARMRQRLDRKFPIIGVGGVDDSETAIAKIEAGADLVQLYTGLVFKGPGLPAKILRGLSAYLDSNNLVSISEVTGRKTDSWAAGNG